MIQIPEHIAPIIIKHLRADQNNAEEKVLQEWINESEEHEKAYQQMVSLWQESGRVLKQPAFDTASAWDKLDRSLAHGATAPRQVKVGYIRLALAACMMGILALAGVDFYHLKDKTV